MRLAFAIVVVSALGGCRQLLGLDTPALGDGGGGGDGGGSALIDAPSAICGSWHAHHFSPCAIPAPNGPLDVTGSWQLSTDTGLVMSLDASTVPSAPPSGAVLVQSSSSVEAYLISIASFTVGSTGSLRVVGTRPLIVASWSTIEIDGTIDVSSTTTQSGAGSDPGPFCTGARQGQTGVATAGSGGGGGGGFGGAGGSGGTGDNPPSALGGAGGSALATPTTVFGGCSGAPSGLAGPGAADPNAFSAGGAGGGAIQLTALDSIHVSGVINAGGAGGGGAPNDTSCGGGGGGAGGFIGFDAASIALGGVVAANGGGGGGGAPFAGTGSPGQDGQPDAVPAMGGAASSCSEAGMVGGAGTMIDGASSTNPVEACGGAGGGGGVGFVLLWGVSVPGGVISPTAIAGP
ncbi:MAG TPA: hypothetical protein VMJ10_08150 [Kofleriaceae bacterium]|nr:hypothetical protein [Kofleriaceae bacterium]